MPNIREEYLPFIHESINSLTNILEKFIDEIVVQYIKEIYEKEHYDD